MEKNLRFTLYGYAGGPNGRIHAIHDHRIGTGDGRGSISIGSEFMADPNWPATRKGMKAAGEWSLAMNTAEGERIRATRIGG